MSVAAAASPIACRLMPDIAVVDYGMGNLRSVAKALVHVAPERDDRRHRRSGGDPERARASCCRGRARCPTACACLDATRTARRRRSSACATGRSSASASGCRCCSTTSEEGPTPCLGALPGRVRSFATRTWCLPSGERLKVPHMGWSPVRQTRRASAVAGIDDGDALLFRAQLLPGARRRPG